MGWLALPCARVVPSAPDSTMFPMMTSGTPSRSMSAMAMAPMDTPVVLSDIHNREPSSPLRHTTLRRVPPV